MEEEDPSFLVAEPALQLVVWSEPVVKGLVPTTGPPHRQLSTPSSGLPPTSDAPTKQDRCPDNAPKAIPLPVAPGGMR